jgi:hypothetical protein
LLAVTSIEWHHAAEQVPWLALCWMPESAMLTVGLGGGGVVADDAGEAGLLQPVESIAVALTEWDWP